MPDTSPVTSVTSYPGRSFIVLKIMPSPLPFSTPSNIL